ncbi:hypothetical protein CFII64_28364 [Pseudomonas sp. CFII64]|nr:hypothetical protein CFII64_28364 [Pseudomonas sp. CFII64]
MQFGAYLGEDYIVRSKTVTGVWLSKRCAEQRNGNFQ